MNVHTTKPETPSHVTDRKTALMKTQKYLLFVLLTMIIIFLIVWVATSLSLLQAAVAWTEAGLIAAVLLRIHTVSRSTKKKMGGTVTLLMELAFLAIYTIGGPVTCFFVGKGFIDEATTRVQKPVSSS